MFYFKILVFTFHASKVLGKMSEKKTFKKVL